MNRLRSWATAHKCDVATLLSDQSGNEESEITQVQSSTGRVAAVLLRSNYLYISSAYSYNISIKNKKKQQRSILANSENGSDTTLCRLKIRHTFLADNGVLYSLFMPWNCGSTFIKQHSETVIVV